MLKPSDFKITGKYRSITEHTRLVKAKLQTMLRSKPLVAKLCLQILESSPGDKLDLTGLKSADINEIKNYFAEVAGPILMLADKAVPGISPSSQVFYSDSDTERLYDFKLVINRKEFLISNKQLKGGTNTLKPGDVIRLVDEDKNLSDKWKRTKYYKAFKTLDESNVVSGPMRVIAEQYPNKFRISRQDYMKVLSKMTQNEVLIQPNELPRSLMAIIQKDKIAFDHYKANKGAAGTMLNFIFEKALVEESKKDTKYNDLFVEVTSGNVSFFKFDIDSKGKVYFEISDPKKATKKAALRSKQGVERRSSSTGRLKLDKLGFQP